jgi:DNA-binding winged helix-turn-helix (wHTH) protein/Tol biopolymer transport system component
MTDNTWKFNDLFFSEKKQILTCDKRIIKLEFRESEVLAYFCAHPNKKISRNELIENVWQGQIVTDNAVNRVITKLRKALGDDAKNAQFIQTLPRIGYKFIANISRTESTDIESTSSPKNISFFLIIIFTLVVLAVSYWGLTTTTEEISSIKNVSALTREGGFEDDATISPNGKYLSYRSYHHSWKAIFIKELETGIITQLTDNSGDAISGNWSSDSTKIIYIYNNKSTCQIREISLLNKGKEKSLHNCPLGSYGRVLYEHSNKNIIYSEKQLGNHPYLLYAMDIDTGDRRKLNQPATFNAGHTFFDLHPTKNELLLSSPDERQWLAFYLLDLNNNQFTYLFNKDEYTCCAIYNHAGNKVVTMGPYPNDSLVEMDYDGNILSTIVKSDHIIGPAKRISNSADYIYSGSHLNFDISFFDAKTKKNKIIADSSVVDRLPSISNHHTQLAYISMASNTAQVWLYQVNMEKRKQLSQFPDHQYYLDLQFSPDDNKLSVLMRHGIRLIDVKTGAISRVKIPQQVVRGMTWFNDETLSFSLAVNGQWRVHHYSITDNTMALMDETWAYIKYANKPQESAFIDQNNKIFIGDNHFNGVAFNMMDHNRVFNFQITDGYLYYRPKSPLSLNIIKQNLTTQESELFLKSEYRTKISVASNGIYYTRMQSQSSDIFRTVK